MSAVVSLPTSIESLSPFRRSPEQRTPTPTKIRGEIPAWLRGEVVRTCPAVFETATWRAEHWFDGLGMIYGFRIGDGSVDFQSRLLETETARDAARGQTNLSTFGTKSSRSLVRRIVEPVPRITDNTNVNIWKLGDELVAMTEGNVQLVIDDETLSSRGAVAYAEDGLKAAITTAHPQFDLERGRVVNVATDIGRKGTLSVYEHAPHSRTRKVVGSWQTDRIPYVHAFGLTPDSAILIAHPFSASPLSMLWSSKGYIDHFAWRPEEGTRLVVIDRTTGTTREHVTDAFFVFHTVNAFERADGATVLDLLAYENADIVAALKIDRLTATPPELLPSLLRITMRPGEERATVERLSDQRFEFPATNYARVNGHAYRYAWGAAIGRDASGQQSSSLVKVDLDTGTSLVFSDGKHVFGEPLFVARPRAETEDDGVLVSVGSSETADTSILTVVDARTMELVASAEVGSAIPLGFHGSFIPAE